METVRDIFDSLRKYLRDRITNPLYGAYLLAWAVLNFRLLLVFVGDGGWREKIEYIDNTLYSAKNEWLFSGFLHPALFAVGFVLLAPYLQRWVAVFLRSREKHTTEQLLKIAGETPLSPSAADDLRGSLLREKKLRLEERRAAQIQIAELSAQVEHLTEKLPQPAASDGLPGGVVPTLEEEEEEEEEGSQSSGDENRLKNPSGILKLNEGDFAGVAQNVQLLLADSGITRLQALALYAVRDGKSFHSQDLQRFLRLSELYEASVLIDKLKGMGLISTKAPGIYMISSAGRQALAAVMSRGFKPVHQP